MKCFLIALVILFTTKSSALLEHRCIYDEISQNSGEMPATIVHELPKKGDGAGQAFTLSANPEWRPIRFRFFDEDLKIPSRYCTAVGQLRPTFKDQTSFIRCTERDILTDANKRILTNELLPSALRLHSERLMVQPIQGFIMLPSYKSGFCATFTPPRDHTRIGVSGADMVLYVAAGPTQGLTAAWAGACARARDQRPILGFVNFGPHAIAPTRESVRVAAHEIAHAMGFDLVTIKDKKLAVERFIRGEKRLVVKSKMTLYTTREHFRCPKAEGMELENEGGYGTSLSHWERRNAKDELMSGMSTFGNFYSAFTMSLFEDTGFYKAIWGKEEYMQWGHNAGCRLLTDKCLVNGKSQFPDMFCSEDKNGFQCTSDRRGIGKCQIGLYQQNLPKHFQYFQSPNKGGVYAMLTDFCPIVHGLSNGLCHNGQGLPGNRFTKSSLCLKTEGLVIWSQYQPGDVCAEVSCVNNSVYVRYEKDETWYPCQESNYLTPKRDYFTAGRIKCPRHADVCEIKKSPPTKYKRRERGMDLEDNVDFTVLLGNMWGVWNLLWAFFIIIVI